VSAPKMYLNFLRDVVASAFSFLSMAMGNGGHAPPCLPVAPVQNKCGDGFTKLCIRTEKKLGGKYGNVALPNYSTAERLSNES
jgi:hypothetical protein